MKVTVAKKISKTLAQLGVTHVFGMSSPELLHMEFPSLGICSVTIRTEKDGAIMADAYSRVTGKVGVCATMRGIGALNIVPGIAEAWRSSIPVVALIDDIKTNHIGRNPAQELDQARVFRPITKKVLRLESPELASKMVVEAFTTATTGRPGPVALLLPSDKLAAEINEDIEDINFDLKYFHNSQKFCPNQSTLLKAAEMLNTAKRPVILAGGGAVRSEAWVEIRLLAEKLGAPVATSMMGAGAISEKHPLSIGIIGAMTEGKLGRGEIARGLISTADCLLILGCKMDQVTTCDWSEVYAKKSIIQIDIDSSEIGRNYMPQIPLVGDIKTTLKGLTKNIKKSENRRDIVEATIANKFKDWESSLEQRISKSQQLTPEKVMKAITNILGDEWIVVADASFSTSWCCNYLRFGEGRVFLSPRGLAGIGWALSAAIGAKTALPKSNVLCVAGDGAFAYTIHELETAARTNTKVIAIVLNNSVLAYQKHYEIKSFGRAVGCDLGKVNFAEIAKAQGCDGVKVNLELELEPALNKALSSDRKIYGTIAVGYVLR